MKMFTGSGKEKKKKYISPFFGEVCYLGEFMRYIDQAASFTKRTEAKNLQKLVKSNLEANVYARMICRSRFELSKSQELL